MEGGRYVLGGGREVGERGGTDVGQKGVELRVMCPLFFLDASHPFILGLH